MLQELLILWLSAWLSLQDENVSLPSLSQESGVDAEMVVESASTRLRKIVRPGFIFKLNSRPTVSYAV